MENFVITLTAQPGKEDVVTEFYTSLQPEYDAAKGFRGRTILRARPGTMADHLRKVMTPEQMAQLDLLEWKCNLGRYAQEAFCEDLVSQATLPNGDGEIKAIANGQIEVTVRWSDSLGDDHTVVLSI